MALKRQTFTVYLNNPDGPDPIELVTVVTFADQLRGEKEAYKQGISQELALATTTVMVWCALVREGQYAADFQTFKADVLDLEKHRGADTDVDPTRLDPSGPPSLSPTGSPGSLSTTG